MSTSDINSLDGHVEGGNAKPVHISNSTSAPIPTTPTGAPSNTPTSTVPATTANTPAINSSASALAANANRRLWSIQNLGTNPLYVRLGAGASTTVFHVALKAGGSNDDGNGGYIVDEMWKGAVSVAGTSPRYTVTELQ